MLYPLICLSAEKDSYCSRILTPHTPPRSVRTTWRPKKINESWASWSYPPQSPDLNHTEPLWWHYYTTTRWVKTHKIIFCVVLKTNIILHTVWQSAGVLVSCSSASVGKDVLCFTLWSGTQQPSSACVLWRELMFLLWLRDVSRTGKEKDFSPVLLPSSTVSCSGTFQ